MEIETELPHVLSTKKQRKALSAKSKQKSKVRQVLSWPYTFDYWPVLNESLDGELRSLIESTLAAARLPAPPDDRKERRQARKDEDRLNELCKELRSNLLLGMNAVTRALEKDEASFVIQAGNTVPPLLGKHVVDMCHRKYVPVLVMPSLKESVKNCLGFSCLAFGLKVSHSEHFQQLFDRVSELSLMFPKSEIETNNVEAESSPCVESEVETEPMETSAGEVYNYRSSKTYRVFQPPVEEEKSEYVSSSGTIKEDSFNNDYVSFCGSSKPLTLPPLLNHPISTKPPPPKKAKLSQYKPLVVKCIQPNPKKKTKRPKKE